MISSSNWLVTLYPTTACVYLPALSFSTAARSERISILATFEVSPVKFLVRSSTVTVYSPATMVAVARMVMVFPSSEKEILSVATALFPRATFTVLLVASKLVVTVTVLTPVWVADLIAFSSLTSFTTTLGLSNLLPRKMTKTFFRIWDYEKKYSLRVQTCKLKN